MTITPLSRASLRSYRELGVWQRSMELCVASHRVADGLPPVQRFGLGSQIRRAAGSVPANIAEGYGRVHRGDYVHHLSIARGSLKELETHLMVANRLRHVSDEDLMQLDRLCWRVSRMLGQLILALWEKGPPRRSPATPHVTPPRTPKA